MNLSCADSRCADPYLDRDARGPGEAAGRFISRVGLRCLNRVWPRRLTVLAYHRIADRRRPDFVGLPANVSATAERFDGQLRLLKRHFQIVSLDAVLGWLAGAGAMPDCPALITFDDGYRDMLDGALPVLRRHDAPAVLFLATDCVGNSRPFFWDLAAYCFSRTARLDAALPVTGKLSWPDDASRRQALSTWLGAAKACPIGDLPQIGAALADALEIDVPVETFQHQHLTWDDVRTLASSGVAIGSHTRSHAILSRIPPAQARDQVVESKKRIEAELGVAVRAFAYPNGLATDYRSSDVEMLGREGFEVAFTLEDGPTTFAEVQRRPLEIRRILVMADDDTMSFTAKLIGLTRLVHGSRKNFQKDPYG